MKYSIASFLVVVALCLTPVTVPAQQGPDIPCVDCPDLQWERSFFPLSGNWYNPQQLGSGFMFEIQSGRLGGIYHHYDEEGSPTWATIIGTLEPGEGEVRWQLETELVMVEGGACLNCPYQQPQPAGSAGTIRFEFLYRNYGRFQVDDGEWQNIVPLLFGVGGSAVFAPYSDQVMPDLWNIGWIGPGYIQDDKWVLVFRTPLGVGLSYHAVPALFNAPQVTANGLSYSLIYSHGIDFSIGELSCAGTADSGPMCSLELDIQGPLEEQLPSSITQSSYLIYPGNIGHKRFEGVSESGTTTLTAFRLGYD